MQNSLLIDREDERTILLFTDFRNTDSGGCVAAMSFRNLVHCALALTAAFAGLAAIYLQLDAQFVGLAQLLVYVGAVAILIVFAVLLTRDKGTEPQLIVSSSWKGSAVVVFLVFGVLAWAIRRSFVIGQAGRGSA